MSWRNSGVGKLSNNGIMAMNKAKRQERWMPDMYVSQATWGDFNPSENNPEDTGLPYICTLFLLFNC